MCVSSRSTRATIFGSVPAMMAMGTSPVTANATVPGEWGQSVKQAERDHDQDRLGGHVSPHPIHWIRRRSTAPAVRYRR